MLDWTPPAQLRVWSAIGRDGRVVAETRCDDQRVAVTRLRLVIDCDPSAAPEGWYLSEGRDLSRGCGCGYAPHSRKCRINSGLLADYDRRGRELARGAK